MPASGDSGAPTTKEADEIGVNTSDEESHGAGGVKAFSRHIGGEETNKVGLVGDSSPKGSCNVGGKEGKPLAIEKISGERLRGRGLVRSKVKNAASDGAQDGAQVWVAGMAQSHNLATDAAFLCVEFEGDEIGVENVSSGRRSGAGVVGRRV